MSARFPGIFHRPGVYAIVHVLSGTRYVGQSGDLLRRFEQHWELLQLAKHHNPRLQKMWDGDGPDAFEFKVVELAPSDLEGMQLQRWLAAREGHHITTFKTRGLAFNIVDAEVVEVAAGRRRQTDAEPLTTEPANPNREITQALKELAPEIERLEQAVLGAEAAAFRHRDAILPRMRSEAQAPLFGVVSLFSAKEAGRQRAAQASLDAAVAVQQRLEDEVSRAKSALDGVLSLRRALYARYSGNQTRASKRANRRARYGF